MNPTTLKLAFTAAKQFRSWNSDRRQRVRDRDFDSLDALRRHLASDEDRTRSSAGPPPTSGPSPSA